MNKLTIKEVNIVNFKCFQQKKFMGQSYHGVCT